MHIGRAVLSRRTVSWEAQLAAAPCAELISKKFPRVYLSRCSPIHTHAQSLTHTRTHTTKMKKSQRKSDSYCCCPTKKKTTKYKKKKKKERFVNRVYLVLYIFETPSQQRPLSALFE